MLFMAFSGMFFFFCKSRQIVCLSANYGQNMEAKIIMTFLAQICEIECY